MLKGCNVAKEKLARQWDATEPAPAGAIETPDNDSTLFSVARMTRARLADVLNSLEATSSRLCALPCQDGCAPKDSPAPEDLRMVLADCESLSLRLEVVANNIAGEIGE